MRSTSNNFSSSSASRSSSLIPLDSKTCTACWCHCQSNGYHANEDVHNTTQECDTGVQQVHRVAVRCLTGLQSNLVLQVHLQCDVLWYCQKQSAIQYCQWQSSIQYCSWAGTCRKAALTPSRSFLSLRFCCIKLFRSGLSYQRSFLALSTGNRKNCCALLACVSERGTDDSPGLPSAGTCKFCLSLYAL